MQSLNIYRGNSPAPRPPLSPDHRLSLRPHALTLTLPRQPGTTILLGIQCLFHARQSPGHSVLCHPHDNPRRCVITLLHLIVQKRMSGFQSSEAGSWRLHSWQWQSRDSGWVSSRGTWGHCFRQVEEILKMKFCF